MKIVVIADPELREIEEMLEVVGRVHNLDDILPTVDNINMTRAEYLKCGWCYLWYDEDTLAPIGYTAFAFERRAERFPLFLMGATEFCRIRHILKIRKAMLSVMRNAFKNQVRAYIDTERIAKFAKLNGFRQTKKGMIWAKAAAEM